MRSKRKPHEERTAKDYREAAAEGAPEAATVLAGGGGIGNQDFLGRIARSDELADHDGESCGQ